MKLAVLERSFSPALLVPINSDSWMQTNHTLDGCLETREVHWLYSLISVNGDHSICLFQVPYTDSVREACREARMPFQTVWQTELWIDQDPANLPQGSSLIIAKVNYDPPFTKAMYESGKEEAKGCFQELNVQHIFSAMTLDGTHSICGFSAASAENVRSLYRKIGQPFEQIWKATLIRPTLPEATS